MLIRCYTLQFVPENSV